MVVFFTHDPVVYGKHHPTALNSNNGCPMEIQVNGEPSHEQKSPIEM